MNLMCNDNSCLQNIKLNMYAIQIIYYAQSWANPTAKTKQ